MNKFSNFLAVLVLSVLGSGIAQAHTTSIGFFSTGNVGEVTFVTGSYNHGGTPVNEGSLTLKGINGNLFTETTKAFDIAPTSTKYSQLIDGTNNFYWVGNFSSASLDKTLTSDPGTISSGGVVWWQAVTFTGLTAGDYEFGCGLTCGTTAQWDSLDSGTGTFNISSQVINGVPEASSIILLGLGLAGLGFSRRQKKA